VTAVSQYAARESPRLEEEAGPKGLPSGMLIAITAVSAVVFYALSTHGTFNPLYEQGGAGFAGRFFYAQAQAMVHGQLHVPPSQLPFECFVARGRCYGYEGITPSLLRIPLLPLLNAGNRSFTPVYMTLALTLAMGSALAIVSHALAGVRRTPLITYLGAALAVCLGPGSVLALVSRPAVYEEAIVWSVGFVLLAVYCFIRWWNAPNRLWAILLLVSLMLSTNSRPTTLPVGVILAAGMIVRVIVERRGTGQVWRAVPFAAAVAILPIATALGVWWFKFHALVPSWLINQQIGGPTAAPWWLSIRRIDHNSLSGPRFGPTALVAYLRPDGVALSSSFPFVNFRLNVTNLTYLGIPRGGIYVEPYSTLTDTMPLVLAIVIAGFAYAIRQAIRVGTGLRAVVRRMLGSPLTYCVLGTGASFIVMLSSGFITERYLADCFPLLVAALAVALGFLARPLSLLSGRGAVGIATAVTVLLAWSLVINLGLDYQYWWHTVA
jgi:hypothetical protein